MSIFSPILFTSPSAFSPCHSAGPSRESLFRLLSSPDFTFSDFEPSSCALQSRCQPTNQCRQLSEQQQRQQQLRRARFAPTFDVKETEDAYEVLGNLPGVQKGNLKVEFVDARTLGIQGKWNSTHESGDATSDEHETAEANQEDVTMTSGVNAADEASTQTATENKADAHTQSAEDQVSEKPALSKETSPARNATVEDESDEDDAVMVEAESPTATVSDDVSASEQLLAAESRSVHQGEKAEANNTTVSAKPSADQQAQAQAHSQPKPRYHISERSTGSFSRSFTFPRRVDHAGTRAELKDGVLTVVVPKEKRERRSREITIV